MRVRVPISVAQFGGTGEERARVAESQRGVVAATCFSIADPLVEDTFFAKPFLKPNFERIKAANRSLGRPVTYEHVRRR